MKKLAGMLVIMVSLSLVAMEKEETSFSNIDKELKHHTFKRLLDAKIGMIVRSEVPDAQEEDEDFNKAIEKQKRSIAALNEEAGKIVQILANKTSSNEYILSSEERMHYLKKLAKAFYVATGRPLKISNFDIIYTFDDAMPEHDKEKPGQFNTFRSKIQKPKFSIAELIRIPAPRIQKKLRIITERGDDNRFSAIVDPVHILYLDGLHINSLNGLNAIPGIAGVDVIDLSNNKLTEIPANAFQGLPNIKVLIITNNKLKKIPIAALNNLPQLRHVSLTGNQFENEMRDLKEFDQAFPAQQHPHLKIETDTRPAELPDDLNG